MAISWELAIATVSEANTSEHWSKKSKRHKQQQWLVRLSFDKYVADMPLPCIVTLTRLSHRMIDSDNNVSAFKYIRDELSECLIPAKRGHYISKKGKVVPIKGRADSDERITWVYAQEKSKVMGIRIAIEPRPTPQTSDTHHAVDQPTASSSLKLTG